MQRYPFRRVPSSVESLLNPTGSRLLCRAEQFLIFERQFSSDDPIRAPEFEPSEGWCEFVISLRPPDPEQLTCPRTTQPDRCYLHHHLVVRVEPNYLRSLLLPEVERVLDELRPFLHGESPIPEQLYLMAGNPLLSGVIDSMRHPLPVGSLRLFYEAKLRELLSFLCFREPEVVVAPDDSRLRQALAYLEAHLSDADALQKMTRQLGVSSRQCQRLFRVTLGRSPSACLTELRMRRAATLLTTTRMSVSEIALEVGYLSLSHFSRMFYQYFGKTPRAFRQQSSAACRLTTPTCPTK
ncbi:MAG: AraC family transcriptional regulator [Fimbriimonadales bacterium]|nr:AraC family transcriptional regulator [Fimbriimonadales bacterium]